DGRGAGKTETELRAAIEQKLRDGYMRDPHVTVFVQRFQSQQVSVTGAVARPGLYSLTRDTRTIYDLLSQAGGLTEQAGGRVVFSPAEGTRCGGALHPGPSAAFGVQQASTGAPAAARPPPLQLHPHPCPPGRRARSCSRWSAATRSS